MSLKEQDRVLPSYRWDEPGANPSVQLGKSTRELVEHYYFYLTTPELRAKLGMQAIGAAVDYNLEKRRKALEEGLEQVECNRYTEPFPSMVPTVMNMGFEVPGISDSYMDRAHASQELFTNIRLGKQSMLNPKFAKHINKALAYTYPEARVIKGDTHQAKLVELFRRGPDAAIVATKSLVARVKKGGRSAHVISRAVGVINTRELSLEHRPLLEELSNTSATSEDLISKKQWLLDLIYHLEKTEDAPLYPVIQSVYITQDLTKNN